ncbi:MAG: hypothetical protein ACLSUW_10515 [Akkermansia sp.]
MERIALVVGESQLPPGGLEGGAACRNGEGGKTGTGGTGGSRLV